MRDVFIGVDVGSASINVAGMGADRHLVGSPVYVRVAHHPSPIDALKAAVARFLETLPARVQIAGVGTTGSGRELTRHILRADLTRTEIFAHAAGLMQLLELGLLGAAARPPGTIIEIGGQDSKVVVFQDGVPVYFNMNSICSAGTGEFLQQLADEIGLPVAGIGEVALAATHQSQIDATCTVFIKRDFRHLTQKGVPLSDRLMGICQAMAANYLRNVVGSGEIPPPYYFQGGVAGNTGVRAAFEALLGHPVAVPPYHDVIGAIGMAAAAAREATGAGPSRFDEAFLQRTFESRICFCHGCHNNCEITEPVERATDGTARVLDRLGGRCERSQERSNLHAAPARAAKLSLPLRRRSETAGRLELLAAHRRVRRADSAYFGGIDGGSRGTKYAAIRCRGDEIEVVGVETLDTGGDAIAAITAAVAGIERLIPEGAVLGGIGTTGSAGELARDIVSTGVRACTDYLTEILAHFAWATRLFPEAATVLDIGGNDAKIIVQRDGALEFAMNDKCAAGTGAFIEAVARRFHVPLATYGALAKASRNPARVAGRCAVFGESDLVHKSRMGYPTADLLLGVAFAICRTYLSDVAKGHEIGLPIIVQGGAFLNDALVHAFREVLGVDETSLIRHPDPRYVIGAGALGAALLARLRYEEGHASAFKGFDAVAARRYETVAIDCAHSECGRRCAGVVALLEDSVPIAGYRSIDCPVGMFEGQLSSEQEALVRALLARRAAGHKGGLS